MVTPRTWVSPRSNSAEPCTRGSTSASADSCRMSVRPRPSIRTPSRMIRSRTSFLVSDRNAPLISFSRPSNWRGQLLGRQRLDPVGLGLPLLLARDRERLGQLVGDLGGHRVVDVLLVVERTPGTRRSPWRRARPPPAAPRTAALMNGLAASRPCGDGLLGGRARRRCRRSASSRSVLGVDSASTIMIATSPSSSTRPATTMSKVASSSCEWVGKPTHWPLISATRTPPIGPENGSPASWVDSEAALIATTSYRCSGFRARIVSTIWTSLRRPLHERRPQRPVDQPAGEDRVLGRPALPAEERAGDPARRVHPLLHVHGEREEVEPFLGVLGRGGRGQHHGLVVEVDDGGAGGEPGQPAGLEPDRMSAECAVVDDDLGGMHTLHG